MRTKERVDKKQATRGCMSKGTVNVLGRNAARHSSRFSMGHIFSAHGQISHSSRLRRMLSSIDSFQGGSPVWKCDVLLVSHDGLYWSPLTLVFWLMLMKFSRPIVPWGCAYERWSILFVHQLILWRTWVSLLISPVLFTLGGIKNMPNSGAVGSKEVNTGNYWSKEGN
jgi:hypothetical protein